MKARALINALILTFCFTWVAFSAPPSDAEARRLLVGDWIMRKQPGLVDGTTTFKPDGKFSSRATFERPDGTKVTINVEGTWRVENGVMIEELTKSSHPNFVPVGLSSGDTILSLTDKEYRYRTESGNENGFTRAEKAAKSTPPK